MIIYRLTRFPFEGGGVEWLIVADDGRNWIANYARVAMWQFETLGM